MLGNSCTFTGHLSQSICLNFNDNGSAAATVKLIVPGPYKDKQTNNRTVKVNISLYGELAEEFFSLTDKGTLVTIDAYAKNKYQKISGQIISTVELIAEAFNIITDNI